MVTGTLIDTEALFERNSDSERLSEAENDKELDTDALSVIDGD